MEVDPRRALFAIADAGAFDAAEGNVRFAAGGRRVDVRHARLDLVNKAEDARSIVRKDRRRQAELGIVRDLHRLVKVFDPHHRKYWTKDFFAGDAHIRSDVIENCWLHEITLVEAIAGGAFATTNQGCAVFTANVQVFEHGLELTFIDARAHFSLRIHAVANAHRLSPF